MTNFNAKQFTKHGFVHVAEEDFSDDGTKFQIWMHEGSGLSVSYARGNWDGKTEYFISPREGYYQHGLLYDDVKNEPEWRNADKFNGCYDVDVDELVNILLDLHAMFLRVKETADAEEIDMTEVLKRAEDEIWSLDEVMSIAKNIRWWELGEYEMKNAARNVKSIEREMKKLGKIINGEIDRRTQRELVTRVRNYGYVEDMLDKGSKYSAYNELRGLAR